MDTEKMLANLDGVAITIQRLPPGHREGDKVYLSFTDASGSPLVGLNVSALAFHHAHASKRQTIDLTSSIDHPGEYVGIISTDNRAPLGLWRVDVTADKATATESRRAFEQTTDLMLSFASVPDSTSK